MSSFLHKKDGLPCRLRSICPHNLRHRFPVCLCIVSLLLTPVGCSSGQSGPNKEMPGTKTDFSSFVDEFFRDTVTGDSLSLHYTVLTPETLQIEKPAVSLGQYHTEQLISLSISSEITLKYLSKSDL